MKIKRKFPYYEQEGECDCGPACIRMALDSFLKPKKKKLSDYKLIKRYAMDSSCGSSNRGIKNAIRKLGFGCKELNLKAQSPDLLTLPGKKYVALTTLHRMLKNNNPIILACTTQYHGKPYGHYVVLIEIDDFFDYIYVNDPYYGKNYKVKINNFIKQKQKLNFGTKCRVFEVFEK